MMVCITGYDGVESVRMMISGLHASVKVLCHHGLSCYLVFFAVFSFSF